MSSFDRTSLRSSFVKFAPSMNTTRKLSQNQPRKLLSEIQDPNLLPEIHPSKLLARYQDESYILSSNLVESETNDLSLFQKTIRLLDRFDLISPESSLLLCWNFVMILALLFNIFEIPIAIFFTEQVYKDQFHSTFGITINTIFIVVLLTDMILIRPNISFYSAGRMVKSHRQSLKKYIKLQFWLDLIGWLVLLTYAAFNNYTFIYVKILFYLYLFTLYRIDNQILTKLQLHSLRYALYKILRAVVILLFIVLWISCIYFAIDYSFYLKKEYYPVNLWLTNSQCAQYQGGQKFIDLIQMYSWYVWLNYAFYWTLQSISMVGYGDMTPRNPPSVLYCDIVILLMTLMYAFFINIVWQIIAQASQTANQFDNNKKYLINYQKSYGLEGKTFNKLGSYMFDMWKHGKHQKIQQEITSQLTQDLRNQLLLEKQKKFFYGIGLFDQLSIISQDNLQLLRQWSYMIKSQKYGNEEKIFELNSQPSKIYAVLIGQIVLQYPNCKIFNKCWEGTTFGLINFFIQERYEFSCTSLSYSKVSYLQRSEFLEALKLYPHVYEKYQELVQDMKIYRYYDQSGEQCWSCSSPVHRILDCPDYFQFYKSIRYSTFMNIQEKLDNQKSELQNILTSDHRSGPKKWKNNNRRQFLRRPLKTEKLLNKAIPVIQIDQVTYYNNYRQYANI